MFVGVVDPVRPIPTHLSAELLTTHVVPDPATTSVTAASATPPSVAVTRDVGELVVDSLPSCPYVLPPQHFNPACRIAQPPGTDAPVIDECVVVSISLACPSSGN